MSFVVVGMDIPRNCAECPCCQNVYVESDECNYHGWWNHIHLCGVKAIEVSVEELSRPEWCELFELRPWS